VDAMNTLIGGPEIFAAKILCSVISTWLWFRLRRKNKLLRQALDAIREETLAPYFDGRSGQIERVQSWAAIQALCAAALRLKTW